MNITLFLVMSLLSATTGLTWLVRQNRSVLLCLLLLGPFPAAAVLFLWAERLPSDISGLEFSRIVIAILVCYFVAWSSLLVAWFSLRIRPS